jgi:hypothetical protein
MEGSAVATASNDPEPKEVEPPASGPVAFLTKIVRLPASNDQTPWRALYLLVIALTMAVTPFPFNAIGMVMCVALALSLGRITH